LAFGGSGEDAVKPYPLVEDLVGPALRVRMPRAPRVVAPGGTMHVVARCNNREFYFTTGEDFAVLLAHLREMRRSYEVTLYAYTLMSNHVHLLLQAPKAEGLGRPLGWWMTETAKAAQRARGRRGYCWERRYRGCLVEDPATSPWSSCAADALRTPNRLIKWHPRDLAPGTDSRAEARNPRWTTQRAIGRPAFAALHVRRRGRPRLGTMPEQNQGVRG